MPHFRTDGGLRLSYSALVSNSSILDIEDPSQLRAYLIKQGWLTTDEPAEFQPLAGGVSNKTVLVQSPERDGLVVKQALPQLRVATTWLSDPRRIQRESLGLEWISRLTHHLATPALLFEDLSQNLLGMAAVPLPHENWKSLLLRGVVVPDHIRQFAQLLAQLHTNSAARAHEVETLFTDRSYFISLRLDPYYRRTVEQVPATARFYEQLIAETLATRLCLVHGDYSPKNVLVYEDRLVLLDHEVIHWGDPAFDLGFALTHLLSKANHLPEHRPTFLAAAEQFWQEYSSAAPGIVASPDFQNRVVRHTLACLLARVHGRSPLEYLTPAEQQNQSTLTQALMQQPPADPAALITAWRAI